MKLLKFEASGWCPACKQLSKTLLETRLEIPLESIEVDEDPGLTGKYNVRGVPTLVLLDADGNEVARKTGSMSKEALLEFVAQTS